MIPNNTENDKEFSEYINNIKIQSITYKDLIYIEKKIDTLRQLKEINMIEFHKKIDNFCKDYPYNFMGEKTKLEYIKDRLLLH